MVAGFFERELWNNRKQAIADLDELLGTDLWMQKPNSPMPVETSE
jgi:hypothetical protein